MAARPSAASVTVAPHVCAAMCADDAAGHAITLLRLRRAHLHPQGWQDAILRTVERDGTIRLTAWSSGLSITVWHHVSRADLLVPGTVVALHAAHGVLAIGADRLSVAPR